MAPPTPVRWDPTTPAEAGSQHDFTDKPTWPQMFSVEGGILHEGAIIATPAPAPGGVSMVPAGAPINQIDYARLASAMADEMERRQASGTQPPTPNEPILSPDGKFRWDGRGWVEQGATEPAAGEPILSPDGTLRWDGRQWVPAQA